MNAPERLQDLATIEAALWHELEAAVANKRHPWRMAVLATVDADGGADARSVVFREASATQRTLVFFADARSPKVRQIKAHPQGTLVLWSAALSWQLRLKVALRVATNGLGVSSRWALLKLTPGAQDYLSPLPPGSVLSGAAEAPRPALTPERSSRGHFAVVTATVHSIDWLELHAQGHRRALFDAQGARWLTP